MVSLSSVHWRYNVARRLAVGDFIIELVTHKTGEQIPMMLDASGMPVVLHNEFILARRSLSTNTLVRNSRGLSVLIKKPN